MDNKTREQLLKLSEAPKAMTNGNMQIICSVLLYNCAVLEEIKEVLNYMAGLGEVPK